MDNKDLLNKIEALEKRLSALESLKKDNLSMFGRSYNLIGNSNSDFLIKTKGQVKVLWGSKFIDIIKDGKINVNSSFMFKVSDADSIGSKDGIYFTDDGQVYLKIGDNVVNLLTSKDGEAVYVSFLEEQETTPEQKYTALTNIGFIYKDIDSVGESALKNGIIYVESDNSLYIVKDGVLSKFTVSIPNPYALQFVILKSDENQGALVIQGQGINNSLAFDKLFIYSDVNESYIESSLPILFVVLSKEKIKIGESETTFRIPIVTSEIKSLDYSTSSGFRLYTSGTQSTLEVDNLYVRNSGDSESGFIDLIYPYYWYNCTNIINFVEKFKEENPEENPGEEVVPPEEGQVEDEPIEWPIIEEKEVDGKIVKVENNPILLFIDLFYKNKFLINDSLYVLVSLAIPKTTEYTLIKLPLKVTEVNPKSIKATIDGLLIDLEIKNTFKDVNLIIKKMKKLIIFLIASKDNPKTILRLSEGNIDLVKATSFSEESDSKKIKTRIGSLKDLNIKDMIGNTIVIVEDDGIYSDTAYFKLIKYINGYLLPDDENSSKLASTEWVKRNYNLIIPVGTIIAYHGETIPEGWSLCDGNNGTPNLIGKFIKADLSETEGDLGQLQGQLGTDSFKYYSLVFIMKIE